MQAFDDASFCEYGDAVEESRFLTRFPLRSE
jgi:hypothetical protein